MIPKEKAKSMIETFVGFGLTADQAKKCAIYAIDEVICSTDWPYSMFYEEVKQEIEAYE